MISEEGRGLEGAWFLCVAEIVCKSLFMFPWENLPEEKDEVKPGKKEGRHAVVHSPPASASL